MSALFDLIAQTHAPQQEPILPEAAIERLREAAARIHEKNPWKPGDIVTMRKDAPIKGQGRPHLVIRAENSELVPSREMESGSWATAAVMDTMTVTIVDGKICPFIHPHWMLEAWRGKDRAND